MYSILCVCITYMFIYIYKFYCNELIIFETAKIINSYEIYFKYLFIMTVQSTRDV